MIEIWKAIPGYDGYEVSNLGNVKSLKFNSEKILKPNVSYSGYLYLNLRTNNKTKAFRIHQLVVMAFLNHIPNGKMDLVVDHINDVKTDNRLENLQVVSQRENCKKTQGNYSSKYKGVSWHNTRKKWRVGITSNGKQKHLGYFTNEYDAHLKYQEVLEEITKGQ